MWNQFCDACAFDGWEVELHVCRVFLELGEQAFFWRPKDVMNFVHLIKLIVAWKQREKRNDFKHDAADSPEVHFVSVVPIGEQAFRSAVPAGGNVLSVWLFRVDPATAAEVGQFDLVVHQKNVFRFDVAVENTVTVHVVDCFQQLVHIILHAVLRQVVPPALDGVVHIHVHEFKY